MAYGILLSLLYFNFNLFVFKHERIVIRNGLSLGYSERDTSTMLVLPEIVSRTPETMQRVFPIFHPK